jgi:hypothetical protein
MPVYIMDDKKKMGAFRRLGLAGLVAASTLGLSGCIGWAVPVHTPNGTMYYTQSIPVPTNANQDDGQDKRVYKEIIECSDGSGDKWVSEYCIVNGKRITLRGYQIKGSE